MYFYKKEKEKEKEQQLQNPVLQKKNLDFQIKIVLKIYSDSLNVFWKRKQHMIDVSYNDSFNEIKISTKARPI